MGSSEKRGSISFFSTYRPPVALDLFSCVVRGQLVPPASKGDEAHMTDGRSYNYNGRAIPRESIKTMLEHPKLAALPDVVSAVLFVSERGGLETLHLALYTAAGGVTVHGMGELFPGAFAGVRMEDVGGFSRGCFFYVSTKEPASERRQPWTAVYSTNLATGETKRLTPLGTADLSPSVSPSGNSIAVASFQGKDTSEGAYVGWDGEIEDLQTNIYVMDAENPTDRKLVVTNGGWPTWGSDDVLFFHRKVGDFWGVFRFDVGSSSTTRVTLDSFSAMTPAAIDATTVAVATIRKPSSLGEDRKEEDQYRHIEIFDSAGSSTKITQNIRSLADHFNPFVIDNGARVGYHRAKSDILFAKGDEVPSSRIDKLVSPNPDVGLFRLPGPFPTFKKESPIFAYVDNEFKAVWLADSSNKELSIIYDGGASDRVWSPVWNQNRENDTLYVCMGPSFQATKQVDICAFNNVSQYLGTGTKTPSQFVRLISDGSNNAFPSSNPDGTKLVFRSNAKGVNGGEEKYKNLYIMQDARSPGSKITRLTEGEWTDTQCEWSPRGNWIVFSSTRDKPDGAPPSDNGLDPGYFAVFLVKWDDPSVVVRVMASGSNVAGHVNHPIFSPDGASIVVAADLAAVSVDPISLPLFLHSVRPYGDIFTVDIDPDNILNNKDRDVKYITRSTHSRFENSTDTWAVFPIQVMNLEWIMSLARGYRFTPVCPYIQSNGGESWHMTGQLLIPVRKC